MAHQTGAIADCLQNEPAFCTVNCPFHLDVRDFVDKVRRGRFNAAYRMYLDAVAFPGIVAALCPEPCQTSCPRGSLGGAIRLRLLEWAAIENARNLEPNSYNLPPKPGQVAIVGSGPSGLACALRLASRKYQVTVFDRGGKVGGHLHEILAPTVFLPEIERQLMHERVDFRLHRDVTTLASLQCDAVYVATGRHGATFDVEPDPGGAYASTRTGVFLGGSLTGADTVHALADGLDAARAIERFLKTGAMNEPTISPATRLTLDLGCIARQTPVGPERGATFTRDEAAREAERCLRCSCDACVRACDLMRYFRKFPKRIAEEVQITVKPGSLDGNATVATRLISTCNHCGLCKEVCPQHIDTGALLLASHRAMREKGTMPWAFHETYLRDMASANTEARLVRRPPGGRPARYLFYPGCQLGASDPRYVTESYAHLLRHWPDTAVMLACCGAPADWAGDEPLRDEVFAAFRHDWESLGRPAVVFACPTCQQVARAHLPETQGVSLYELLADAPPDTGRELRGGSASVFDPCASRAEPGMQQAVRRLLTTRGMTLEPLSGERRRAECCGWGGQVAVTHPSYATYVTRTRAASGVEPYVTYCANCRDLFASVGKPARHVLDVLFGLSDASRPAPTLSARRLNRLLLKRAMLTRFFEETCDMDDRESALVISPELRQKLGDARIPESDVEAVVEHCESTGRKVVDPSRATSCGYRQIGHATYWVEYRVLGGGRYEVLNAYSHRMTIEES